ncbi:unnamed protein product, partial [Ectocarpus fasciculatus]
MVVAPPLQKSSGQDEDEPRSPLSLRPLFDWEKSLASHILEELSLRWSTAREEALSAASLGAATGGGGGDVPDNPSIGEGTAAGGGEDNWRSGRRGCVRIALDQVGEDGSCHRSSSSSVAGGAAAAAGGGGRGASRPRHPEAVPECLLGVLLPPVRLSCLPGAFVPSVPSVAGGGGGGVGWSAGDAKGLFGAEEGYPRVEIDEAGRVEVE